MVSFPLLRSGSTAAKPLSPRHLRRLLSGRPAGRGACPCPGVGGVCVCGDAAGEAAAGGEGILFDVKPAASNDRSFISGSPGGSPGPRSAVREAEAGRGRGWGRGRAAALPPARPPARR